ncbi:MAG TPA: two-component regulator propeller domain-containing protein [Candidatus Polarisedimenticolia bacterium]|nr:two-component regulator propeller domain-containing protein [Candidatus Polarisedimenticolia bacterium]
MDPNPRLTQYAHTAWRVRDGTFAGAPTAITQTSDGYIWIGTLAGLLRFDGARFVPFVLPTGKQLPSPAVIALLGATDGSVWIGTSSGLAQWKNGELFTFPQTVGRVNSIYEDRDGTIWITRSRTDAGGVCKVALSAATCYTPNDGVPPNAGVLIKDNLGFFLIGHSTGIVRWKPGSSTSFELPGLKSNRGLAGISDLALASDGSVWAGLWNPGHGLGLERFVNNSWKTFVAPTLDSRRWGVNSLRLDRHNALWIATDRNGIYRIHDGDIDRFSAADGLSSDSAGNFLEDKEGNLWLTTAGGVDCFRSIAVVSFSVQEGLGAGDVGSIFAGRNGTVWIGASEQLNFVRGNVVSSIGPKQGLRGNRITSLLEDHIGRLWVGLDDGLLVYEHGRFTPVHRPDGGPVGIVLAMIEDTDLNVWASVIRNPPGRPTRLVCFRDGRFVKEISNLGLDVVSLAADPQDGLWLGLVKGGLARYRNEQMQVFPLKNASARVNQVLANSDGSVSAATNDGLVDQQGTTQHTLDSNNGLPCNRIYALVTDKHSDLWLYAECGLIEIKPDDLQHWHEHPDQKVKFNLFDGLDGAQPYLPAFRPIATRSNDGLLWFANGTVAQMIDPDGPLRNPIPPPVHIEDVIADRKAYSLQEGLHLPALTRDLEIDYTALSFIIPQKVHFQYKLEGYDRDWKDAGTRRQAFYSNLPPRNYVFRVKACNNSGLWNEAGASLDFFVAPAFYQTVWFRCLGVLLFLVVLNGLYRLRFRHLRRQRDALREREKELKAAEQEHEKMRQLETELAHINRLSMLGEMAASLAHEIKQPIAAVITSANTCIEWLSHEPPNLDRARAAAARIDKYGNRAAEIIDGIRSLYKKSPPQRDLVDVNGIIHEMLMLLEGEATRFSIAIRTDLSAELPKIMVDRVRLQQVFLNLMLNAIEAMREEGGEVTVRAQRQDGQLLFSISDTGPGLPSGNVDLIFSAFFTTKSQGSGMGLAISRSIVESHGGLLWATTNEGQGATFHFTLPTEVREASSSDT